MSSKSFDKFLLQEGLRQDSLINGTSWQLGTKVGLFMVFAAFIFTAESAFANLGTSLGIKLPHWALIASLLLALFGILVLLWSARLLTYRMPPILPILRSESERFFDLPDIKNLTEEEQMQRFEGKFINSLTRSIADNFEANRRTSRSLVLAAVLVGASLSVLSVSLLWAVANLFWRAFPL